MAEQAAARPDGSTPEQTEPPAGATPLRWVLYTMEPVTTIATASTIIAWYERRPTIEDYHQALKTGCGVERRYYETAERWLKQHSALLK